MQALIVVTFLYEWPIGYVEPGVNKCVPDWESIIVRANTTLHLSEPIVPIVGMTLRLHQSFLQRIGIDLVLVLSRVRAIPDASSVQGSIHAALTRILCY